MTWILRKSVFLSRGILRAPRFLGPLNTVALAARNGSPWDPAWEKPVEKDHADPVTAPIFSRLCWDCAKAFVLRSITQAFPVTEIKQSGNIDKKLHVDLSQDGGMTWQMSTFLRLASTPLLGPPEFLIQHLEMAQAWTSKPLTCVGPRFTLSLRGGQLVSTRTWKSEDWPWG